MNKIFQNFFSLKYFFLISTIFSILNFSHADELKFATQPTTRQIYTSNSGNKYIFVGDYEVNVPTNDTDYQNQIKTKLGIVVNGGEKYIVEKFTTPVCKTISPTQAKLVLADPDLIDTQGAKIAGNISSNDCITYGGKIYIVNSDYNDINYLMQNFDKIFSQIKAIGIYPLAKPELKLSKIYNFVTQNSSYSYESLYTTNYANSDPWKISSFFEGKKIVCDAYVKTMILIAKMYNINLKKELGRTQPLDAGNVPASNQYHTWISYGGKYFDPTFDDSGTSPTQYFFNKSKTCFQLNHYQEGDILFQNSSQRYDYIIKNQDQLMSECPGALKITLVNDDSLQKFLVQKIKSSGINSIQPITQVLGYKGDMANIGGFGVSYSRNGKTTSFYFKDLIAQAK